MRHRVVSTTDGTQIAAYHAGSSGPHMVLANGLGGNIDAWSPMLGHFKSTHQITSWDYRGLYQSEGPTPPSAVSVDVQARDMLCVMDDAGITDAVCVGWSMGCQVILECFRLAPDRIRGMVLMGGASGNPLKRSVDGGEIGALVRPLVEQLHRLEPHYGHWIAKLAPLTVLAPLVQQTGLVSHCADSELLRRVAAEFMTLNFDTYLETITALDDHDASDILDRIKVPTLIVVGENDLMTPVAVSRHMHAGISNSELMVVRGGTHYVPIEFPELINLRVEKFLRERVYKTPTATSPKSKKKAPKGVKSKRSPTSKSVGAKAVQNKRPSGSKSKDAKRTRRKKTKSRGTTKP